MKAFKIFGLSVVNTFDLVILEGRFDVEKKTVKRLVELIDEKNEALKMHLAMILELSEKAEKWDKEMARQRNKNKEYRANKRLKK